MTPSSAIGLITWPLAATGRMGHVTIAIDVEDAHESGSGSCVEDICTRGNSGGEIRLQNARDHPQQLLVQYPFLRLNIFPHLADTEECV